MTQLRHEQFRTLHLVSGEEGSWWASLHDEQSRNSRGHLHTMSSPVGYLKSASSVTLVIAQAARKISDSCTRGLLYEVSEMGSVSVFLSHPASFGSVLTRGT